MRLIIVVTAFFIALVALSYGSSTPPATGVVTTAAPSYTPNSVQPLSMDTSGNLRTTGSGGGGGGGSVTIVSPLPLPVTFGGSPQPVTFSSPVSVTFGSPVPVQGTVIANQGAPGPNASPWPVALISPIPLPITGTVSISSFPSPLPVSFNSPVPVTFGSPVPVQGTVTANQGSPGPSASPWPVAILSPNPLPVVASSPFPITFPSPLPTIPISGSITLAPNTAGSGSAAGATVSTVITLTTPANAVGFVLMCLDTSTANIRWSVGRTATTTLGQQLQPGRDSGFVPVGANVSIVAESGTQNYDIQWISSQ